MEEIGMNYSNSIFKYATSELSQDAFICWLCSFLLEENKGVDPVLETCAVEFVQSFLPDFCKEDTVSAIIRQKIISFQIQNDKGEVKDKKGLIDVLLEINGKHVIIEDKTFTSTHGNQINHYKIGLINKGIKEKDIICVYYKTSDQPYPEEGVDFDYTREKLLNIFEKYENKTDNAIFLGYLKRLQVMEEDVNSYQRIPIEEWYWESYVGFYKEVCERILKPEGKEYDWKNVNNPSGGFLGLWWGGIGKVEIEETILSKDIVAIYPQFEQRKIAIKVEIRKGENKDEIRSDYLKLQKYAATCLGESFKKLKYSYGTYMTLAYLDDYNYENYKEKMELIEKTILGIPEEFKK